MPKDTPTLTTAPPVLACGEGRGRVGKSTLLRWVIDRARNAGRLVTVADGDRNNATLTAYYRDACRPVSAEQEDAKAWLTSLLNGMAEDQRSVVLDLGGGDRLLAEYGRDLALVEFCRDIGAEPLALVCLGPDLDDLAHAVAMEDAAGFAPERTVLVLNEGLVPVGRQPDRAFAPLVARPEFRALLDRGAQVVAMPRLPCMADVDARRLDFFAAAEGAKGVGGVPLGPVQRSQTKAWIRRMEEAFAPVSSWLP